MATNTYVALKSTTLTGTATSVTLSSIPSGYTDLVLVANMTMSSPSGIAYIVGQVGNGSVDTGNNYSFTIMYGDGSSTVSYRDANKNYFQCDTYMTGTTTTVLTMHFQNYANTSVNKTFIGRSSNASKNASAIVNLWRSTSAINTIKLYDYSGNSFAAGSTFTLYGVAAVAPLTAKASGGTIYYGADGYVYHKFTSSGTFTPSSNLTADILVVGGGGGGATSVGGGGGGGGLLGYTNQALTTTGYTVTIGQGGTAVGSNTAGVDGSPSSFGALTAAAGGGGGGSYGGSRPGNPGGSGGGGCGWATTGNAIGGAASPAGQGYAGGNGGGVYNAGGSGGGGGAGGPGQTYTSGTVGAEGGPGSAAYSNWGLITGSGVAYNGIYYFAAGAPGVYGLGGTQASSKYGSVAFGAAVTANTGQGGCGDYGYAGSAGIVIVRYPG